MKIILDEEIKRKLPEFLIGYAIIKDASVEKSNNNLKNEIEKEINEVRKKYISKSDMYAILPIKEMREIFKKTGISANRYIASAEALLRRILDGKELYQINNVVECNNLGSIKFALPMGVYNTDNLSGDVLFKIGSDSDTMDTMAKGKINMKDILLTRDNEKLFGSPISDSPHTIINEKTKNILLLVYGTSGVGKEYIANATEYTAKKIMENSGGIISKLEVITSE